MPDQARPPDAARESAITHLRIVEEALRQGQIPAERVVEACRSAIEGNLASAERGAPGPEGTPEGTPRPGEATWTSASPAVTASNGASPAVPGARPPMSSTATIPGAAAPPRKESSRITWIPAAGAPPPELGRAFGPYRLDAVLGRGGMGIVYDAVDTRIGRRVALKTLTAGDGDVTRVARFQREVEIASKLKHPNIVTIYDVGVIDQVPYFAMEFLEGESLSQVLAVEKRLPPRAAARVVREVARALSHAHEHGTVHRDVKPQNVMVEAKEPDPGATVTSVASSRDSSLRLSTGRSFADFRVVLTDFGLARELSEESWLTRTGEAMGTPLYMPPEQAQGLHDQIGPLSDVYSAGAVLYELLTGRPPFDAPSIPEILQKVVLDDPVPPSRLVPNLAVDLEVICLKAMQKSPSKRYASARDLTDDLDRFLQGAAIHARPPTRRERLVRWVRRHPTSSAVSAVLLVVLLAGSTWLGVRSVRSALRLSACRAAAEEALATGDPDAALSSVAEATTIAPTDPSLKAIEGRARADKCVAMSDGLLSRRKEVLASLEELRGKAAEAAKKVKPYEPAGRKQEAWRLEDEVRLAEVQAEELLAKARQELARAIGFSPDHRAARERLRDLYMRDYERAWKEGDAIALREARRNVEFYDPEGALAGEFEKPGIVALVTDPPGADVYAFRYEEVSRRLVACPFDVASGKAEPPAPSPVPPKGDSAALRAEAVRMAREGRKEEAQEVLARAIDIEAVSSQTDSAIACVLACQGKVDAAFDHLEEALKVGWKDVDFLQQEPAIAPLRASPRFPPLLAMTKGTLEREHVRVLSVAPDSPAERAGFRPWDAILEVNGAPLKRPGPLAEELYQKGQDGACPTTVWRDGENLTLSLVRGRSPGMRLEPVALEPGLQNSPGAALRRKQWRARTETPGALLCSDRNRLGKAPGELRLRPGSYLLLLHAPGRVDVRYPVAVERGGRWEGKVCLPTQEGYPPVPPGAWTDDPRAYWCLVPGGPFTMGNDPEADHPIDMKDFKVETFFIGRFETGWREWESMFHEFQIAPPEERLKVVPDLDTREWLTRSRAVAARCPTGPAQTVTWPLAEAHAAWLAATRGGEDWQFYLPTEDAWEKAARGVDGRFFPWGNQFDWSFCYGASSLPAGVSDVWQPHGLFPTDESPYGVRDMAGGVTEWCRLKAGGPASRPQRGGSYAHSSVVNFRSATRYSGDRMTKAGHMGYRLVAIPK